ncbi:ribosome hibernation factor-recruiting GTPase MRF [Saccharopolyspora griseoalba]|uniref:Ribosome hibernation factor-recruiting GTPase MRF n=1 Tax=Saccharopolyspora griseoalba TaxID=1431848 RepID=A0ABW2LI56_9PSEU
MDTDSRTPLIMVAGIDPQQVIDVAEALWQQDPQGTALVHHDLRAVAEGVVSRNTRHGEHADVHVLELAHGCVSCTLREDMLPLLRRLAQAPDVRRIVVRLDTALEPETICWALRHVEVDGRPLITDVSVEAVLATVDRATFLADASGDEELVERGVGGSPDDERTVAQVAVGQVEFADALVLAGEDEDRWQRSRLEAVLARLTPAAPRGRLADLDRLLAEIPESARRGEVDGPHGRLLRGQPSLETDAGVSTVLFEERRPFHPQRLHEAIDVLLEGVIRARGRVWVATQPDEALWIESAGSGLAVGQAGPWLAALDDWSDVADERRFRAELTWDDYYGDRAQELVVIAHEADPGEITRALRRAVLTDDELAAGREAWGAYEDPFAEFHRDPCEPAGDRGLDESEMGGNQ